MKIPGFNTDLINDKNPYEKIIESITDIRNELKKDNKLGFIKDQIVLTKQVECYDLDYLLILPDNHSLKMVFTLSFSEKKYLPHEILTTMSESNTILVKETIW